MELLGAMRVALSMGVVWGIMAIGVFITYSILNFSDLTVDGSFALGGIMGAMLIEKGMNPFVSLGVTLLGGAVAGAMTGLIHTKLKIPAILSSILCMTALYSITLRVGGGPQVPMKQGTVFSLVGKILPLSRDWLTIVVGGVVCLVIVGILYWFFGTEVGSAIRATGDNQHMARALGVSTDFMIVLGLMVSNGLVALSGSLAAQNIGTAHISVGQGTIVTGLASVVIGNVLLRGKGNFALRMFGVVLGSVVYQAIIGLVLQLGLSTNDQKMITAVIVIVALSVPNLKEKMEAKKIGEGRSNA